MSEEGLGDHLRALGQAIRAQRQRARLSLRDLAARTDISNAYLSQLERGLHEPSVRVLRSLSKALDLSAEVLLGEAGLIDRERGPAPGVEDAIRAESRLTDDQKEALISVYRAYLARNG